MAAAAAGAQQDDSGIWYYVKTIDFNIEGRTRSSALLRAGEFAIGTEFAGKEALDRFVKEKTQSLINHLQLEQALIEYTEDEPDEDGRRGVNLLVSTVDTTNFVILPQPKFDSNGGFEMAFKIRDYNFLGNLTPLGIDVGFLLDDFHLGDFSKGKYALDVATNYPFRAAGFNWNVAFSAGVAYVAGEPFSFKNVTGLSLDIPVKDTTLTFGFDQGTVIEEEYFMFEKQYHDDIFEDIEYMYSKTYGRWVVPLGVKVPVLGDLVYTPEVSGKINYRLGGVDLGYRHGPILGLNHKIGFEKLDRYGNFRDGFNVSVENSNEYNVNFNEWNNNITFLAMAHKRIGSIAGISGRLRYKQWFNDPGNYRDRDRAEAGNMLRGVLDRALSANYMLSLNLDFPIHVLNFEPAAWFNVSWFRYFHFEIMLSPIIDMAFINGKLFDYYGKLIKETSFVSDDFIASGGIEMIAFPLSWRNLVFRCSFAINFMEAARTGSFPSGDNREIYIGLDYSY
ncbi:MAG: hypothetical protein LBS82_03185 [Spirochaetaceae bacterium]|jgi:hypothetical protein|nr:hypothetical protein [Spirochaetaceae bacterium]